MVAPWPCQRTELNQSCRALDHFSFMTPVIAHVGSVGMEGESLAQHGYPDIELAGFWRYNLRGAQKANVDTF
jgi:hypothetical protein